MGVLFQVAGATVLLLPAMWYLGTRKLGNVPILESCRDTANDLRLLVSVARPKTKQESRDLTTSLLLTVTCLAVEHTITFGCPLLLYRLLNQLTIGLDAGTNPFPWAGITLYILLKYQALTVIQHFSWIFREQLEHGAYQRISVAAYDKALSLSAEYHDRNNTASWADLRSRGDEVVHTASAVLFMVFPSVMGLLLALGTLASIVSYRVAAAALVVIVVNVGADGLMKPLYVHRHTVWWMETAGQRNRVAADVLTNWWTVFSSNRIGYEKHRFADATQRVRDQYLGSRFIVERAIYMKQAAQNAGLLVVCLMAGYEGWRSPSAGLGAGGIVLVLNSWEQITQPLTLLPLSANIGKFCFTLRSLLEIFKREVTVRDREGAADLVVRPGTIEVRDVAFTYPGQEKPAITALSFLARAGQTIALVGETGAGKSTVMKLLMRAYDRTSGSITIDGQDIRDVRRESLGKHISVVPQTVGAFDASVIHNIRYGRADATLEECQDACRAVGLHDKISGFEKGYDERIGERGVKLSAGELQRLAIARVLVRDTKIVLFDEATSNLDSETEYKVQQHLQEWCAGRTVVVVADRLRTITHANQILAVREGVVVEQGTHRELLGKKGYYYELWEKQKLTN